ncbi:MAG: DNA replication/repair protein RecF [Actinobacteria bacterium]|nr:DNA replication/repair protein RecF [Actinomycetota bacterium]MBU1493208.1 DNA replication/repair protein RecF [Actinomycetota bacterium]
MELGWIELIGYRCYPEAMVEPAPGVNVFVGDNGTGKTSLLEAIGYLASLASFRRSPDPSLVRRGQEAAVVRGEFVARDRTLRVEVEIPEDGRRRVLVNGKRPAGRAEVVSAVPLVAFLPDDLDLVKRGPSYRRDYLDDLAAGLWPAAGAESSDYERVLRQRNTLLRRDGRHADRPTLDVWDERLSHLGAKVIKRRLDLLSRLEPRLSALYADLGERPEPLSARYHSSALGPLGLSDVEGVEERLAEALAAARMGDMERRISTVGPHRDEVMVFVSDRDLRTRASQGEQRTVALGLRVAAYELLREEKGATPMLILDDVFSELDPGRSRRLVGKMPDGQIFVSTAREEEVPLVGTRWSVADGVVRVREEGS